MRSGRRILVLTTVLTTVGLVLTPASSANPPGAAEATSTFEYTENMHPMGYSERIPITSGFGDINSDVAFWGKYAFQGHYTGFRIIDISAPANPRVVSDYDECGVSRTSTTGQQGDVIVWDDILVRSWDGGAGGMCGDLPGVSGLHVFDISNPRAPEPVGFVNLPQGSHTATGVPDLENNRLLVYSSPSSGSRPGIDIVEVPLDAPEDVQFLHFLGAGRSCHDTGVILGEVMLAACAGGNGFTVFSMHPDDGGSLELPVLLYNRPANLTIGHSAAFTWDGALVVVGHEPGGGTQARCQETSNPNDHTMFFFEARTGIAVGSWTLPRKQTAQENCTIHNYNIVPTDKRYIVVSGNYQSGVSVVDFTDPQNAVEIAFADPAPLVPTQTGGDWSTYWYNGFIYEADIRRGLIIWNLSDNAVAGAKKLSHLNPQTQEFSFPFKGTAFGRGGSGGGQAGGDALGEVEDLLPIGGLLP